MGDCKHYNQGYCYYYSDSRTKDFCENICECNCGEELDEEPEIDSIEEESEDLGVNMKRKSDEKMIKNITLTFEDGTTETLEKEMVITLTPKENEELNSTMEMCNMNGTDVENTMYGVLQLAAQFADLD